jgi:hypothetical protein
MKRMQGENGRRIRGDENGDDGGRRMERTGGEGEWRIREDRGGRRRME